MKSKKLAILSIVAMFVVSKSFGQVDLRPSGGSFAPTSATALVTKANQLSIFQGQIRVYVDLETNTAQNNPIAQFSYVINGLGLFQTDVRTFNPSGLSYRAGFSVADVTRMVIKVDPKNEIQETNENNNRRVVNAN